jgi:hypothetical protein
MFRNNRQSGSDTGAKAPAYVTISAIVRLGVGGCLHDAGSMVKDGDKHMPRNGDPESEGQ